MDVMLPARAGGRVERAGGRRQGPGGGGRAPPGFWSLFVLGIDISIDISPFRYCRGTVTNTVAVSGTARRRLSLHSTFMNQKFPVS